ncbi:type II secretion system F family protein [Alkalihalobacillus sp. AL-G]|uniref:type II secretion system F family protein n=1 Tax=Alkalihalobacillus sp. AL-G TaxID=2926399 RepID=UPI0027298453|nr:type II secretion system F family protein [Alkalihalobacillus sp. AL-G]WLD93945.1 type II secretion system F family protein [Alkalihalobacillus sp. AL-G]
MMYISFFATVTLFLYSFYVFRSERKNVLKRRLSSFVNNNEQKDWSQDDQSKLPLHKRVFKPMWREFRRGFKRKIPGEKQAKLEVLLLQAGNPMGMTPFEYRLIQLGIIVLFPVMAGGWGTLMDFNPAGVLLMGLVGGVVAFIMPPFYIKSKIKARSKTALLELPDILDLLTVSLEAGLGFDGALSKVVSKKEGVLSMEFHRCLEEIRLGRTRRESLRGVRNRLVVDEISGLISSILQAEKLGIGMVNVLRIQSEEVRDQRKQRAEQEAMKAPIKMLFPLVLFIFPSLFIVLLGPAVLQFIETFNK